MLADRVVFTEGLVPIHVAVQTLYARSQSILGLPLKKEYTP